MKTDEEIHLENTRKYYNEKFAHLNAEHSGLNAEEEQRWRNINGELNRILLQKENVNILDFGCGRGWLSDRLRIFGKVTAVDISDESIHSAEKRYPEINFICADITSARITEKLHASFNLVVSSEVIEHVTRQQEYVQNICRLLKKNAFLILTTPNGRWKKHYFYRERKNWGQAYESWLTAGELEQLLRPHFKKISIRSFNCDWIVQLNSFGLPHLLGAGIWIKFLKAAGLLAFYKKMLEKRGYGLYLLVTVQSE